MAQAVKKIRFMVFGRIDSTKKMYYADFYKVAIIFLNKKDLQSR